MTKNRHIILYLLLLLFGMAGCNDTKTKQEINNMEWTKLPDLPGTAGMASLGVSAPFTAIWNERLIVAGGCNFPDKPVTEGGVKRYYDEIFALDLRDESASWKLIGHLPEPVAYGATAVTSRGIVCIGGNDSNTSFSKVLLLIPEKENVRMTILPSLPVAVDNMSASTIGDVVYVAGGNADGAPSNVFYSLDLCNMEKGWDTLPEFPGAKRVQPVLVAQQANSRITDVNAAGAQSVQAARMAGVDASETQSAQTVRIDAKFATSADEICLFLAGGFQPAAGETQAQIPTEVLIYSPADRQWKQVSSLPPFPDGSSRTLTGGTGVAYGDSLILFAGGVNYDRFLAAVDRSRQIEEARKNGDTHTVEMLQKEAAEYMFHPVDWYRFNSSLLIYHTQTGEWTETSGYEPFARAGAGLVVSKDHLIVVNGELKPGIRTPKVNRVSLKKFR